MISTAMLMRALTVRVARRLLLAAGLCVCLGESGRVLAQGLSFSGMYHKGWVAEDGAPQGVTSLAQAADGILWIGAESGLFSFDGRTFSPAQAQTDAPDALADAVKSVLIGRDGAVWVGFRTKGVARILNGHVTSYSEVDGKRLVYVSELQQSSEGAIWAISAQRRPIKLGRDGAWHFEAMPLGEDQGPISALFIDSTNTLWLAQSGKLFRRPLSQSGYFPTETRVDSVFGFAETPDHSIWISDGKDQELKARTQHLDPNGKVLARLPDTDQARVPDTDFVSALLLAPDGSLVQSPFGRGLLRVSPVVSAGQIPAGRKPSERYMQTDGLTSDAVHTLLLDRDGNIWVGGARGLDRFRPARMMPLISSQPLNATSLCASPSGTIWITTNGEESELYKVTADSTKQISVKAQLLSISCAVNGDAWLVTHNGISNIRDDRIRPLPTIPRTRPFKVRQVVAKRDGQLFASVETEGIWRFAGGAWTKLKDVGPSHVVPYAPYVEYIDPDDRLWTGLRDGLVGLPLEGNKILSSGRPGLGTVYTLLKTTHGMLAAGLNGVGYLRNEQFKVFKFADGSAARAITGMVESNDGDLWLNALSGVIHITAAEVRAALNDPEHSLGSERITEGDYAGSVPLRRGKLTAAKDAEGKLWFLTMNGVVYIDPRLPSSRSHFPIVSIRSVEADAKPVGVDQPIGPGTRALSIQYLGVNLTEPEKVTYRYRLDGLDSVWQDGGRRTEANYANLPPGTYTFRVMASNDGQTWTLPVSSQHIKVLPRYYQSPWFWAFGALLSLALVWLIFILRLRFLSREIRTRADERAEERIRIARDLHDTLLQGVQGLLLTVHVAAQKATQGENPTLLLNNALSTADRIIIEGRNRVNSLRSEHLTDAELIGSIENTGIELGRNNKIAFHVSRGGSDSVLPPHVADEAFFIAREALTNAFRHADATEITVQVIYGRRHFSISCIDNGRGFSSEDEEQSGHWGLKGMTERAELLGGKLHCSSQIACGTRISFMLPSYRAYERCSRLNFILSAYRSELIVLRP